MEPTNYPFKKDKDFPNLVDYVPAVILQGLYELDSCN